MPTESRYVRSIPSPLFLSTIHAPLMADEEECDMEEDITLPPSIEETLRKLEQGLKDMRKDVDAIRRDVQRIDRKGWTERPLRN